MTLPSEPSGTVADAVRSHWTERLPSTVQPFAQMARWDRPIGWWLLLWPCWWSLALALNVVLPADGQTWLAVGWLFALFLIGSVAMRGAGCTWNDITDRELDAGVARTRSRPLPSGRITVRAALIFLVAQLFVGLLVLLQLQPFAIMLGFMSVPIVVAYPFAKRITDWPQLVLGLAFSWGALMGWAAYLGEVSPASLALYLGAIAWTVGYDTIYAHQDREDDALVGVRSTARLFGNRTKTALVPIYGTALVLIGVSFALAGAGFPAWVGLVGAAIHIVRQIMLLDIDNADECLALFRSNTQVGWLLFAGLIISAIL